MSLLKRIRAYFASLITKEQARPDELERIEVESWRAYILRLNQRSDKEHTK